jgi:hypothetical protein
MVIRLGGERNHCYYDCGLLLGCTLGQIIILFGIIDSGVTGGFHPVQSFSFQLLVSSKNKIFPVVYLVPSQRIS